MNKAPAFQFYADDFIGGTITMSHEERGLYVLALCIQWGQGSLAHDDIERLGSGMAQPSLSKVKAKFELGEDGRLRQHRMEKERMKQASYRAERSESGKKGAKSKWANGSANGSAIKEPIAQPMANAWPPSPSPSPSPSLIPTPPPKKERAAAAVLPFPENWTPERKQAMQSWIDYKRERGAGYKPTGWKALCSKLEPYPDAKIVQCVSDSMANNWNGLFPDSMAMGKAERPKNIYTGPVV